MKNQKIDLSAYIGQNFGNWMVIGLSDKTQGHRKYLQCQCRCGKIKDVRLDGLKNGTSQSCGCIKPFKITDEEIVGKKFGRLTVRKRCENKYFWECECSCGNTKIINSNALRTGAIVSCGCITKEKRKKNSENKSNEIIGQKFGDLTVLYDTRKKSGSSHIYKCKCECECGNEVEVSRYRLEHGEKLSCGHDNLSIGAEKIMKILNENNISYEMEKKFDNCINPKTGKHLRFDFYVDNRYIIEFDGNQHFHIGWNFSTSEEDFEKGQYRDIIKAEWCAKNNIPLIRIPYNMIRSVSIDDLIPETSDNIIHGWISQMAYSLE